MIVSAFMDVLAVLAQAAVAVPSPLVVTFAVAVPSPLVVTFAVIATMDSAAAAATSAAACSAVNLLRSAYVRIHITLLRHTDIRMTDICPTQTVYNSLFPSFSNNNPSLSVSLFLSLCPSLSFVSLSHTLFLSYIHIYIHMYLHSDRDNRHTPSRRDPESNRVMHQLLLLPLTRQSKPLTRQSNPLTRQ